MSSFDIIYIPIPGPIGPTGQTGQIGPTGSTGELGPTGASTYTAIAPTAPIDNNGLIVNNTTNQMNLEFADTAHNGIVSLTTQSFTGAKTFTVSVYTPLLDNPASTLRIANTATQYPIGNGALAGATTGGDLIAIGNSALGNGTSGDRNIAIGTNALQSCTGGFDNLAVGVNALQLNTGTGNVAIGNFALENSTAAFVTAVGYAALQNNTTGDSNVAVGDRALTTNTTGFNNTAVGDGALAANIDGVSNSAVGAGALFSNTSGSDNTSVGGNNLASNTTGNQNTAMGSGALALNTVGSRNTAVGFSTLGGSTGATGNTAIGANALKNQVSGGNNIAVGLAAGFGLVTGSNNIYIGVTGTTATESNVTRIANITGVTVTGAPVLVDANNQLGVASSLRENKEQIEDLDLKITHDKLMAMQCKTFYMKNDQQRLKQNGMIAEEMQLVDKDLCSYDDGKLFGIHYHQLVPLLVGETQYLNQRIEELVNDIRELKNKIN